MTPFSARALDRGLSGVYVSQVRLLETQFNANESAGRFTWPHPLVEEAEQEISHRAGLVASSDKVESLTLNMLKSRRDEWLHKAASAQAEPLSLTNCGVLDFLPPCCTNLQRKGLISSLA